MKKLLFLFAMFGVLTACSSDDSSGISAESSLKIDGAAFNPSAAKRFIGDALEHYSIRNFNLVKANQSLTISLGVPLNASETGTYSFGPVNTGERYASGGYTDGSGYYTLLGEVVEIQAMENSRYKITLVNAVLKDINTNQTKTITGSFEGTFTTVEN